MIAMQSFLSLTLGRTCLTPEAAPISSYHSSTDIVEHVMFYKRLGERIGAEGSSSLHLSSALGHSLGQTGPLCHSDHISLVQLQQVFNALIIGSTWSVRLATTPSCPSGASALGSDAVR